VLQGGPRAETEAPLPGPIAVARVLDAGKAKLAASDFGKMIARYCATGDHDEPRSPGEHTLGLGYGWEAQELDRVGWRKQACPRAKAAGYAIASGSFSKVGADEALIVAANGKSIAEGDYALILMGRDDRYRIRRILVNGHAFSALARARIAGSRDVLFICQQGGEQSDYRGRCGFLGRGSFHAPGLPTSPLAIEPYPNDNEKYAAKNELALRRIVECGRAPAVEIGKVEARGDHLIVQLVVENAVYTRSLSPDGGGSCDHATRRRRRMFDIAYQLERGGFRRVTPIPAAVKQVLNRV